MAMDNKTQNDLIEELTDIEVKMEILRKQLPTEVESLERLLNIVDELNNLGQRRDDVAAMLRG